MSIFMQDLRFGLRMLGKRPAVTIVAVLALAIGIGANSAFFSVVNRVLLQPLPYPEADRLVMVWEEATKLGYPKDTPAPANFVDWRDQSKSFEGMAAMAQQNFNLTGEGEPERLEGHMVSHNLFSILGITPVRGRGFLPEEDQPGKGEVVVISYGLWQRRFGGSDSIVGKTISLNGKNYSVVGVMPKGFKFPNQQDQLWVPLAYTAQQLANRNNHFLIVVARIKPGITLEQAQADVTAVAVRLQQQYPDSNTDLGVVVEPLREHLVGDIKPALLVLLGAVGFVLLIACANVANLLLAQAAVRRKETAIRAALGAGRLRLIRQFLTESVLLSALGGITGLLLALGCISIMTRLIPKDLWQVGEVTIDKTVLAFTFVISVLSGIIFGLVPAFQASRTDLNDVLKEGGKGTSVQTYNRTGKALVIAEVALSLVLLIGAGLMINSFIRLNSVDAGFQSKNLLTMRVALPRSKYPTRENRSLFYQQTLERVRAIPGVQSAAFTSWLPLTHAGDSNSIYIEGSPEPPPNQYPLAVVRTISPDYLRTMGIALINGRDFNDQDTERSQPVIIVNEALARTHWPNQDALGKRLKFGRTNNPQAPWYTVVGVTRDVREFQLQKQAKPQLYLPFTLGGITAPQDLVVRTAPEPLDLATAVRNEIWAVDKELPVSNISTMERIMSESLSAQRFNMLLFAAFAIMAMVLASVGIYGVISYSVTQRTHEIGIRMAMGARPGDIFKLVVGQGLALTSMGIAIGALSALLLSRLVASLLFGVSATDPATFIVISAILLVVALLAAFIPARRAARVEPLVALRYD